MKAWLAHRDALLGLMAHKDMLYVYDLMRIRRALAELQRVPARILYAVKANSHPRILQALWQGGCRFDCVSWPEVEHILHCVPGVHPEEILFTPNFADIGEYKKAFELGCCVTVDNATLLERHPQVFAGQRVLLRFDPGEGKGHHRFVRTGGRHSKFGMDLTQAGALANLCRCENVEVFGLHAHVGSGIMEPLTWVENARRLARLAGEFFPGAKILDLGGGLGVAERPEQVPFELGVFTESLAEFSRLHPEFALWLEPGRFLVAEAGVLLARVTQIKEKGDKIFVGLNAGMNALIRPALYEAYHPIVNLSRAGDLPAILADVVGPICECADVLGYDRELPTCYEKDVFLIANVGAYGRSMASAYNLRPAPEEAFLPDKSPIYDGPSS